MTSSFRFGSFMCERLSTSIRIIQQGVKELPLIDSNDVFIGVYRLLLYLWLSISAQRLSSIWRYLLFLLLLLFFCGGNDVFSNHQIHCNTLKVWHFAMFHNGPYQDNNVVLSVILRDPRITTLLLHTILSHCIGRHRFMESASLRSRTQTWNEQFMYEFRLSYESCLSKVI